MSKVYYEDCEGDHLVDIKDLLKLSDWLTDDLIIKQNFYKKNNLGHIIVRIVERDNGEIFMTIKALSKRQGDLYMYDRISFLNLKSFEEARLKSELITKELGYNQNITLGF